MSFWRSPGPSSLTLDHARNHLAVLAAGRDLGAQQIAGREVDKAKLLNQLAALRALAAARSAWKKGKVRKEEGRGRKEREEGRKEEKENKVSVMK